MSSDEESNTRSGHRSRAFDGDEMDEDNDNRENGVEDSEDDEVARPRRRTNGSRKNGKINDDYKPGAIVRVKVVNFVTYERAEFFPGAKLNMVIGPNGTGKSSVVCAICLGLGYHPKVLGRASSFSEFVKHGSEHAVVEVELKKRDKDASNYIVKLKLNSADNNRKFSLNGQECNVNTIKTLMSKLRIQVDNLCQFLPQDKVPEFAGLSPVDLLTRTLQATAPEEMQEWHGQLKKLYKEQQENVLRVQSCTEDLASKEARQLNLQADVDKLREREQVQKDMEDWQKAKVFAMYDKERLAYRQAKDDKKDLERKLKKLQDNSAPALEAVNKKEAYQKKIHAVVQYREGALKEAERAADGVYEECQTLTKKLEDLESKRDDEYQAVTTTKKHLGEAKREIHSLETKYKKGTDPFDPQEWNQKIHQEEHVLREKKTAIEDIQDECEKLKGLGIPKVNQRKAVGNQLKVLESEAGAQLHRLRQIDGHTATAYEWLTEHADEFEGKVFGPPMILCSIKDDRYQAAVEGLMGRPDFLVFTCQKAADHRKLSEQLYKKMKLQVTIRTVVNAREAYKPPVPKETLHELGLDGFAIDYLKGPDVVLAMLCATAKLHSSPVGLKDMPDHVYDRIMSLDQLGSVVAGNSVYRVSRRREYGPDAVSTSVNAINRPHYWTNNPVDEGTKTKLRQKIMELQGEIDELKTTIDGKKAQIGELRDSMKPIEETITDLKNRKAELQKTHSAWKGLPHKIEVQREKQKRMQEVMATIKKKLDAIEEDIDKATLEKAETILRHRDAVLALRTSLQDVVDAKMMNIEAISEVAALKKDNAEIHEELNRGKAGLQESKKRIDEVKRRAQALQQEAENLPLRPGDPDTHRDELLQLANNTPMEQIDEHLELHRNKLEVIQAGNPQALAEYSQRQGEIEKLKETKARMKDGLDKMSDEIAELRGKWEPGVDALVDQIDQAFSYNFEQISCAGEVSVHKEEDFEKWAIEIKVKFRQNETLQLLDPHRQSGGERSVSTIFYLMSLQALAQAPFRVVDEINQGMDPRNERMVHERMVEIACREHTSQYFLITPKLLSNLRYDEGMRVLCINSGPRMPTDGAARLDTSKFAQLQRECMKRLREAVEAL